MKLLYQLPKKNGKNLGKFIEDFKKDTPVYLLYEGPYNFLTNKKNMKIVEKYIKENYQFYTDFKGWIIYKLK